MPIIQFHAKDHEDYHNKVKWTAAKFEYEEPVFVMSDVDRLRVRNLEFQPIHVPERKRVAHSNYKAADLIRFPPGPDGPDGDDAGESVDPPGQGSDSHRRARTKDVGGSPK